ncbi:unnamed protein product [Prorocentrum cordatum]|uniref:Uncharacterized protein n=1 Tax=Prorocentrum cordatum TaxID=2364126 RepID=A0ABN9TJ88_9DINO|nr:unnamed protein product [Polarella glacialis]
MSQGMLPVAVDWATSSPTPRPQVDAVSPAREEWEEGNRYPRIREAQGGQSKSVSTAMVSIASSRAENSSLALRQREGRLAAQSRSASAPTFCFCRTVGGGSVLELRAWCAIARANLLWLLAFRSSP